MPNITDYASLKQAVLDFSHKSNLTAYLDYFIQDAQEQINADILQDNMGNGIKPMEKQLASVAIDGSGQVAVPADYLCMKSLQLIGPDGSRVASLEQRAMDWIYDNYPCRRSDRTPKYFAREGSHFIFGPYPDTAYNVHGWYYQLAPLLSSEQTTNWMVTSAPLMLHAACMLSAMKFLKDSDGIALWGSTYKDKLDKLLLADKGERWNASGLAMELG
jgi:hypothetical protein